MGHAETTRRRGLAPVRRLFHLVGPGARQAAGIRQRGEHRQQRCERAGSGRGHQLFGVMLLLDDFLSGRATTSLLMGLAGIGVGVLWVRARRIDFFAPQPEPTPSTGYLYLGPGAVSTLGGWSLLPV